MVFSSPVFLFLFLPLTLAGYFAMPGIRAKNLWLLAASLLFYAWGEVYFVLAMVASILANTALAAWIDRRRARPGAARAGMAVAVAVNIGMLLALKYWNFAAGNLNALRAVLGLAPVAAPRVPLPIGISFFTFQALSYVIDVYRRDDPAERNPLAVGLYISLFPQLIAGPIVRYKDVAAQIRARLVTARGFARGIGRFTVGLAKKMIVANTAGAIAERIFPAAAGGLTPATAWFGVFCYALQIYFDFSGYSDMAIGLGRMFGFRFMENFNYPYVSQSLREFWQRWHISLSTWFRDYLYIPMGGSRAGGWRTYRNLAVVFLLCGLWHGASWTFVAWGLFHGVFLVLERLGLGRWVARRPRPLRHAYVLALTAVSWVLFRCDSFGAALAFLAAMAGRSGADGVALHPGLFLDADTGLILALGALGATPIAGRAWRAWRGLRVRAARRPHGRTAWMVAHQLATNAGLAAALFLCALLLAKGTYNPFIYFRF